jgi:hypothetical protein
MPWYAWAGIAVAVVLVIAAAFFVYVANGMSGE